MTSYADFLASKRVDAEPLGFPSRGANGDLFEWQSRVVDYVTEMGSAAIFADCGLGKSRMQLDFADRVVSETGGRVLILAPLSVVSQTIAEGVACGIEVHEVTGSDEMLFHGPGVFITNFEKLHRFDPRDFVGVVLDESSILKSANGATRTAMIDFVDGMRFRLACSATPAPNNVIELLQHAQFLGRGSVQAVQARYFTTNMSRENGSEKYRLKGHAASDFYDYVSRWAVCLRSPADVGGDAQSYSLPPLAVTPEVVDAEIHAEGQLFPTEIGGIGGRASVRRQTRSQRVERTAGIVNGWDSQAIVWVGTNDESESITEAIDDSMEVTGSMPPEHKRDAFDAFKRGDFRVLVTKPTIAGFGLNFQNAHRMAFCGIGDSYEQYYQAIRRCYRFGQTRPVDVRVVVSDLEQEIALNVARKQDTHSTITNELAARNRVAPRAMAVTA
jgi:hypothetical protein